MKNPQNRSVRDMFKPMQLVVLGVALVAVVLAGTYAWRTLRPAADLPELTYWPTAGWQNTTPEAVGFDSEKLVEGLEAIKQNGIKIHSLMMVRGGSVFFDAYFYPYDGSTYHDQASVTKSVMTTLIGIAADQGKLELDQPALSFFPDRAIENRDARKERITVRHLAGMASGLMSNPSDELSKEMQASSDWVQYSLDRPVVSEPGSRFVYDNAAIYLLSPILQQATGMTAEEYARVNLFGPLGITDFFWATDPQGHNRGWGDLSLHPEDAAKLGLLFLHQGRWEDRQLISRQWVEKATTRLLSTMPRGDDYYGYGWWVTGPDDKFSSFRADGRGGQYILVVPTLDLVVVTTGGGFDLDQIGPYMEAAIGDLEKPLPANEVGVARLEAAIAGLVQPPVTRHATPLPNTARAISGRTFVFDPNDARIRSLRVDFDSLAEATYYIQIEGEAIMRVGGIGLDGVYRPSRSGWPMIARAEWADDHTLVVEFDQGPGLENIIERVQFEGDRMVLEIAGLVNIEGRLEEENLGAPSP